MLRPPSRSTLFPTRRSSDLSIARWAAPHVRVPWRNARNPSRAGLASPDSAARWVAEARPARLGLRSEEHTSELQSLRHLVCRLLLEKKKKRMVSTHGDEIMT